MSILNNLPHTCTAKIRTRTADELGGSTDTFTNVFEDRACWQQAAGDSEILEFAKRGISVTHKVYFTSDPGIGEQHILIVTGTDGVVHTLEVRTKASPDASAGKAVVYRVMAEMTTTGSAG